MIDISPKNETRNTLIINFGFFFHLGFVDPGALQKKIPKEDTGFYTNWSEL